jgi:hypothetical protein
VLDQLKQLPADVWKVQAERRMVSAVWGEGSGVEQAQVVDRVLKALALV